MQISKTGFSVQNDHALANSLFERKLQEAEEQTVCSVLEIGILIGEAIFNLKLENITS